MLFPLQRLAMAVSLCLACAVQGALAQTPVAWLRYAIPPDPPRYHDLPHAVVLLGNAAGQAAPEELAAADELDRGLGHMVAGTDLLLHRFDPRLDSIVLGTTDALHRARLGRSLPGWTEKPLPEEGFRIVHLRRGVRQWYILQGGSPRAELWAAFRFAALVAEDQQLPEDMTDTPALGLRAVDLGDGAEALARLEDGPQHTGLARLLSSVGINGILVEADAPLGAKLAMAIRPYGMRLWLRTTAASTPEQVADLAATVPDLGGTVVRVPKHAGLPELRVAMQQANAEARLLRRAGAAVVLDDALGPPLREPGGAHEATPEERANVLRGALEPNVILLGAAVPPMMPLAGLGSANFGLLPGSPQLAAFDIYPEAAESLAYPAAPWESALQTPETGVRGDSSLYTLLHGNVAGGVVGMLSERSIEAMLQQPLLQANLYAFGRVAWCPTMSVEAATEEWSRQTWGDDARAHGVATRILLASAAASLANRAPFGLPLLAKGSGGPEPAQAAHLYVNSAPLADGSGIGVDRTAGGTNEIARYPGALSKRLADPSQTPEAWLLTFHRLPYDHPMKDAKTLAQSFYDVHFAGASTAANALDTWESTRGLVDEARFTAVHTLLARAATEAEIWREISTEWMQRTSGKPDASGFVGRHPGRVEAEAMKRSGYAVVKTGPDAASGGALAVCDAAACQVSTTFEGSENVYRVEVGYIDEQAGCKFSLLVNGTFQARWVAPPGKDPAVAPLAAAARFVANGIRLKSGDTIEVQALTEKHGKAPLDFIEITRDPRWN